MLAAIEPSTVIPSAAVRPTSKRSDLRRSALPIRTTAIAAISNPEKIRRKEVSQTCVAHWVAMRAATMP